MNFELKDVVGVLGSSASIIFASWIFMGFLEARYSDAYTRYRALIDSYRDGIQEPRKEIIRAEILIYRRRVDTMRQAMNLGMYAAIMLISALILAAFDVIFPHLPIVKYIGATLAIGGLMLIIWSATKVVHENTLIRKEIGDEVKDIPELADDSGEQQVEQDPKR